MTSLRPVRLIVTDIEGTTSSIHFVKEVLFPYASDHLADYLIQHQDQLDSLLKAVITDSDVLQDDATIEDIIQQLQRWIAADVKATPLKTLQGMIWQRGYICGDYQAHIYPDAVAKLRDWSATGLPLYVYSSGSVQAQQLFFQYSDHGDLRSLFTGHFDTQVGAKQDPQSYLTITQQLRSNHADLQPQEILFLSDIEAELEAAEQAGMQSAWLRRPQDCDPSYQSQRACYTSFSEIEIG